MTDRAIATVVRARPQPGTGILHPFPSAELEHLDPFVFLDTGAPLDLGEHDVYVGPHSHRGVQPVSLLFRGRIEHRDSLGNERTVTSGGMQWLVAGSGALHEDVLNGDDDGLFHMAQLWVNLPRELKMKPAEHHAMAAKDIPEITSSGAGSRLRLYAGEVGGVTGPAPLPTPVLVAHITFDPSGLITIPIPAGWTASFMVVEGGAHVGDTALETGHCVVFDEDGDAISVTSPSGAQLLLMCGEPIGEPIAMGGGHVMNTRAEIDQAFADDRAGAMGSLAPSR